MNCPACDQLIGGIGHRIVRPEAVKPWDVSGWPEPSIETFEVCDEWCAYTMRERWADDADPVRRTHEALESAAKSLVMEQARRDPSYAQWVAQQIFAWQQAQMGAPGWLQQMMMQGHQVGLGPVTFGEKIP